MDKMMFDINENIKLSFAFSLIEFDEIPIVFLCTDANMDLYFCLCTEIRSFQQWVIKKTDSPSIEKLINKLYDLKSFIEQSEKVIIAHEEDDVITYKEILVNDIDQFDMPTAGVYLDYVSEDALKNLKQFDKKDDIILSEWTNIENINPILENYKRNLSSMDKSISQLLTSFGKLNMNEVFTNLSNGLLAFSKMTSNLTKSLVSIKGFLPDSNFKVSSYKLDNIPSMNCLDSSLLCSCYHIIENVDTINNLTFEPTIVQNDLNSNEDYSSAA